MGLDSQWSFRESSLSGVYEIQPFCASDNRGFFLKDYSSEVFSKNNIEYKLKETFYSFSEKNVVRGLHFQRQKQMPKLVRCISGKILDVVCDLRKDSPSFGKWISFVLSGENMKELLIPGGFAHGFLAVENSMVVYKCAEVFNNEYDDGIIWNDKEIGVDWGISGNTEIILSQKDRNLQTFNEFVSTYGSLSPL